MQNQVELLLKLYRLETADNGEYPGDELKAFEEKLDPSLLKYYRRIKQRRGSGVAVLRNRTCSKCQMVYPEAHPVVQCSHIVHKCEYCGRLLVAGESSAAMESVSDVAAGRSFVFERAEPIAPLVPCSEESFDAAANASMPERIQKAVCESAETERPLLLHVDDDEGYRTLLKETMEKAGFSVVAARDGKEALEQLAMQKFALIISELRMPNHDGIELLEEMNRRRMEIPVIFVASSHDQDSCLYVMGLGAYGCLRKSDGEESVVHVVRTAVSEQTRFVKDDAGTKPQSAILLVDGDSASRKALKDMLESHDYVVYDAVNGTEALRVLSEYSVDLIISEARLPDFDGVDLLKKIRSRGIETEIIFLTVRRNWKLNVDLMNMGAFDYMDKPVDENKIISAVAQALDENETKLPVPHPQ